MLLGDSTHGDSNEDKISTPSTTCFSNLSNGFQCVEVDVGPLDRKFGHKNW